MSTVYLGNKDILQECKIGFLCSRKVPAEIILKTYDWAIEQREKGICIVSGFHSKIEKDVFHYLLKGTQPIVMVLARGMKQKWSSEIKKAIKDKRLLIMSPFDSSVRRVTNETAQKRNEFILELADRIYIAYVRPNGALEKLINMRKEI